MKTELAIEKRCITKLSILNIDYIHLNIRNQIADPDLFYTYDSSSIICKAEPSLVS